MSAGFADYLDAKFGLDERSLNREVRAAWGEAIGSRRALDVLDIGTGTGASILRLLRIEGPCDLGITAVDRDAELLRVARRRLAAWARRAGGEAREGPSRLAIRLGERSIELRFQVADLVDFGETSVAVCDLVQAHALLDLLPTALMAGRIARWLRPGGLVYASLDYDGGTTLLPVYRDAEFEGRILEVYDASMELRRVRGLPTGGAHAGRRLHGALLAEGLDMMAVGSSDWNLVPLRGAYRDGERDCLRFLLRLIRGEAERSGGFPGPELERWYQDRAAAIGTGRLGLICHQLDLLARKPAALTP